MITGKVAEKKEESAIEKTEQSENIKKPLGESNKVLMKMIVITIQ